MFQERYIGEAQKYYEQVFTDIEAAKNYIHIETYILEDDIVGRRLVDLLRFKVKQGVTVYLEVDGAGSFSLEDSWVEEIKNTGIHFNVFNPLSFKNFWGIFYSSQSLYKYKMTSFNKRNHKKIISIDGKILWIGSYNFTHRHLPKILGGYSWQDSALRIEKPSGEEFSSSIRDLKTWRCDLYSFLQQNFLLRIRDNFIKRRALAKDLFKAIGKCTQRIIIITPYFMINRKFTSLLIRKSKEVNLKILLSGNSDVWFYRVISPVVATILCQKGVQVFFNYDSFVHSKITVMDQQYFIGSSNLNYRSLYHDEEADYFVQTENTKKELQNSIDSYFECAEPWDKARGPKGISYFFGRLLLVLRYWL